MGMFEYIKGQEGGRGTMVGERSQAEDAHSLWISIEISQLFHTDFLWQGLSSQSDENPHAPTHQTYSSPPLLHWNLLHEDASPLLSIYDKVLDLGFSNLISACPCQSFLTLCLTYTWFIFILFMLLFGCSSPFKLLIKPYYNNSYYYSVSSPLASE